MIQNLNQSSDVTPELIAQLVNEEFHQVLMENHTLQTIVSEWADICTQYDIPLENARPFIYKAMICKLEQQLYNARYHLYRVGVN